MPSTIREVAREAGVSVATVSHALSGNRPVSAATRRRIARAARELGYRPNRVAASMITGRTQTLGMIVPDIGNPFFGGLCAAAERAAAVRGYAVVACSSELDPALEARTTRVLADRRVDALLYLAGTGNPNRALRELSPADLTLVALDEEVESLPEGCSLLAVDNEAGGALAAEHLLALGHRELGVVAGPSDLPTARARTAGFVAACQRVGISIPSRRVYHAPYTVEGGRARARELLSAEPAVTAIFSGNDLIALGVLEAVEQAGRIVPADLSVVGFDDIFVAALARPPLTTIRQPIARLGKEAAELAIDIVEGRAAQAERRILPVELVVRGSTTRAHGREGALAEPTT